MDFISGYLSLVGNGVTFSFFLGKGRGGFIDKGNVGEKYTFHIPPPAETYVLPLVPQTRSLTRAGRACTRTLAVARILFARGRRSGRDVLVSLFGDGLMEDGGRCGDERSGSVPQSLRS